MPPLPLRHPGRAAIALLLAALCVAPTACRSPRANSSRARQEQENLKHFQDLIQRGTLRPAKDFEDREAPFSKVEEQYADPLEPPSEAGQEDRDWALAQEAIPPNPYLEFGEQIIVYDDGRIMKPYPFPSGLGSKIHGLLLAYGNFPIHDPATAEGPQPPGSVVLDFRENWIVENWSDPRSGALEQGTAVTLGDMLFVTATPDLLAEVEHFINLFAANVRQIEIEAKIVEVTTRDSLDLGVRGVDALTPILGFPEHTFVQAIDWSFPAEADPVGLMSLSAVQDAVSINAVLEAVAQLENVSIISRPKVAVREGGRAEILNTQEIPYLQVTSVNDVGGFNANVEFREVGVQMYVIPRVVGTDTVVLNIDIEASQETGSAVIAAVGSRSTPITNPTIGKRKARTIVRLEPGQAVILGGLISERTVERERKVPLVGDIPLLGYLFRSTSRSKEQTNVLFFIRPRILEGSDLNRPFE